MWIRQVIVPSITDDEQDLLALKDFIVSLKTVEKVELIPYHTLRQIQMGAAGLRIPLRRGLHRYGRRCG